MTGKPYTTTHDQPVNADRMALKALRAAILRQISSDVARLDRLAQLTAGGRA